MAIDDTDEFGLSSSDEADLLNIEAIGSSNGKRKNEDVDVYDPKRVRVEPASAAGLAIANKILKERFGMNGFRLKQEPAIGRLLDGGSSVVVFPTGGGKSLCYQVPALCFRYVDEQQGIRQGPAESGITLVVSPLIALMKDQVDALKRRGISAAVMDSTKTKEEHLQTVDAMRNGTLDLLYCAPERLNNEGFVSSMANVKGGVRLLAIDEAHCISEWGHAFRPDYLKVARFAKEIEAERVVCLTATATPHVAEDVCKAFDIPQSGLFRTTTFRSNLHLHAQAFETKKESYPKLRMFLKSFPGSTIIYVTLQKQAEELAEQLRSHKFKARHFHAGMKTEEKMACQDDFMSSDNLIIVATIAFGMGIDKANIRNVIHYDIPRSLEGYSQEIGRAGRDGLESRCMLYLCAEDYHIRESFARGELPSKASVANLLKEVFSTKPTPAPESHIQGNLYQQSKQYDIKVNTLNNIYAQLELRFRLLRATTPKYTKYTFKRLRPFDWDKSTAGKAVQNHAKLAKTVYTIDVDAAATTSGLSRHNIVRKLNDWHESSIIDLQSSGVVNIYRVEKNWPPAPEEQQRIVDDLYKDLEFREQQALQRMHEVTALVTGESCFAYSLAKHFGDALPDGAVECGQCTWCEKHKAVEKIEPPSRGWDSAAFFKILEAVPDRDDPRYLARIAFGITSPRVTQARLSGHKIFGSMEDQDFMTLLNAFTKVCEK
ncbi:hypothetical protein M409DRAFT_70314 [Zasmidium cellare ATCC 36951]|uniref:ATP-dependent DNA helicase n=1 Tax=Zasmidium cellare ATCC 36951 TaxID=1080233 RepID=A0A6A6C2P3_ZASCE|nr:uncharacterized protein M409DRAFT_70314 [Zasmidium cellare ATCC 36951]KAF2160558.1 hypothetical protein M409DRAFT_70314 [Zasmidium cellare ATCC 36951]